MPPVGSATSPICLGITWMWAWGTVWLDFDNDGRLDVYGLNGFVSGPLEDDL